MNFVVDGRAVFAYSAAHALDPARATVAFLHGAGLDHSWFALQSRYFGYHGRNVLAVDFPGHGRSAGPPLASIEALAAWVIRVLDAAGVGKASLVGHSMGSLTALECAARHADRVERIALIGTAFPMKVSHAFLEAARNNDHAAYDMETIWGHAPEVPLGGNPYPGMWMYGDTLARLERLAPGVLHAGLKACNDYAAGLESAAHVKCPALLLLGRRDLMTPPRAASALAAAIPGARTVTLPSSGHSLMAEAPDAVLDALIDFLG
ncbi:MAG: alpha/beta hydrolase [Betaproteobacteria bacterium]|nr:MAG: alpha/beta hydrolase [Betaproteobacteria bacterium]